MRHLLVLDDEALIAWDLADEMEDFGWSALVALNVDDAQRAIAAGRVDAAVLDYHLDGETSEPVAQTMLERGLPFVFVTGALLEGFPTFDQPVRMFSKPADVFKVDAALRGAIAAPGRAAEADLRAGPGSPG